MRKPKSMIVEDHRSATWYEKGAEFKILKVKNSTEYIAGAFVSKSEVDQRIQYGWDVTINPKK